MQQTWTQRSFTPVPDASTQKDWVVGMKIVSVKPYVLRTAWRNLTVVKIETDAGISGIGEATIVHRDQGVLGYLADITERYLIGADPFDVERLWQRIYTGDFIRGGWISAAVQSAVDVACYDIMGKALGVPVWKLIGGRFRDRVPAYANGWYTVERTPEAVAARSDVVAEKGYGALKIDPFGPGAAELDKAEFRRSLAILEALRDRRGADFEIFVEGHARFTVHTAVQLAKAMEPLGIGWFEEPCTWDYPDGWRQVRAKTRAPIAGGEHFFNRFMYRKVFEEECLDIIQPDLNFVGGFTEVRKVAAMAEAYQLLVAPHNSQGPLNTAATIHFAVACPNFKIQECFDDFWEEHVLEAFPGAPRVVNGHFEVPTQPGLGVELNEEVFRKYPFEPRSFDLFAPGWELRGQHG